MGGGGGSVRDIVHKVDKKIARRTRLELQTPQPRDSRIISSRLEIVGAEGVINVDVAGFETDK